MGIVITDDTRVAGSVQGQGILNAMWSAMGLVDDLSAHGNPEPSSDLGGNAVKVKKNAQPIVPSSESSSRGYHIMIMNQPKALHTTQRASIRPLSMAVSPVKEFS
jgi:hypothetical protein